MVSLESSLELELSTGTSFIIILHQNDTQWIGLRDNLQENPIFDGKIHGLFPVDFPLKQSIEIQ